MNASQVEVTVLLVKFQVQLELFPIVLVIVPKDIMMMDRPPSVHVNLIINLKKYNELYPIQYNLIFLIRMRTLMP